MNDRPWPSPRYKAGYRALFLALTLWDIRTTIAGGSLWWASVALTVFQVGIWVVLELSWLQRYDNWVAEKATRQFLDAAQAGLVHTECPTCREKGVPFRDLMDHYRLFHPDVDMRGVVPDVALQVRKPPLWVRLW